MSGFKETAPGEETARFPIALQSEEGQSYQTHIQLILAGLARWRKFSETYAEVRRDLPWTWTTYTGAFDITRKEGVISIGPDSNVLAFKQGTDTQRAIFNFRDEDQRTTEPWGSRSQFQLCHLSGEPFVTDPYLDQPLDFTIFTAQAFPRDNRKFNYELKVESRTKLPQEQRYAVVYYVSGNDLIERGFHGAALIGREHALSLVGVVDNLLGIKLLGQPSDPKQSEQE